jgi:hypothetical protein
MTLLRVNFRGTYLFLWITGLLSLAKKPLELSAWRLITNSIFFANLQAP